MTKEQYLDICNYLAGMIAGTEWENHVFVVGGAVRSFVMDDVIKDIDLVIDLPGGGIRFGRWIRKQGYTHRPLSEFVSYGVTKFRLDEFPNEEIECVYTRCEKYPDRTTRNPVTEFGSIEEDCFRRDLTVNALYYNVSSKQVLDLTGKGLDDIRGQVIRVTTQPMVIFDDDPLRILRAVRFAARFGWKVEEATFEGMKANVHRLSMLVQERVNEELNKMLQCDRPGLAMRLLAEIGALPYILPEFVPMQDMVLNKEQCSTVWEHTLAVLDGMKSRELELRLAALFHDLGKITTRTVTEEGNVQFIGHEKESARLAEIILRRMKYPATLIKEACFLVENHMRLKLYGDDLSAMKPECLRKFMYQCGSKERFLRLADLINADNNAQDEEHCLPNQVASLLRLAKGEERMFGYRLPINGRDVMENCEIQQPSDIRLYLKHALVLAFTKPDMTREEFIHELKRYKIK